MQTFLPYESFALSAQVLDTKRLGKQRVECLQILNTLTGRSKGWTNHPAVKMWRGYEGTLYLYGRAICHEWIERGYKDSCTGKLLQIVADYAPEKEGRPAFLGNVAFHTSHQSNLLRKDFTHYSKFFTVPIDLPYVWPA
jgi:hypothetical protein